VQPVALFLRVPFDEAAADEVTEGVLGGVDPHVPDGRYGRGFEGADERREQAPEPAAFFAQQLVAQVQGGFDGIEPLLAFLEAAGIGGRRKIRPLGERAAGEPQRQRQPAAEAGDLVRVRADPWRDPEEQVAGLPFRHLVQVAGDQTGEGEMEAGRDQQQGAGRRDQRLDLFPAAGVVHEEEGALAVEHRPVQPRQVGFARRHRGLWMIGPDHVRHGLRRGEGLRVHALEIEIELGVGVGLFQLLGELESEGGLADSAHAAQAQDAPAALGERGAQRRQVRLAAGEVGGRRGELVEGGEGTGGGGPDRARRTGGGGAVAREPQDLLRDLHQLGIALAAAKGFEGLAVARSGLESGEPGDFLPEAGFTDDGNDRHPIPGAPFQEARDFGVENEIRGEGVRGDQQDGHAGLVHGLCNLVEPFIARLDVAVVPGAKEALLLEDAEVLDEAVFPDLVLVAVADEDGLGHFVNFSAIGVGGVPSAVPIAARGSPPLPSP